MWGKLAQYVLQIFAIFSQNKRDSELKADGARKQELESRDKQDEIRAAAKKHREKDNSSSDADVIDRL